MHGISDLPLCKDSIQCDGIVLDIGPMGPIFLVWIRQTLWVMECTVRDWDTAIFLVHWLFQFHGISDVVLWFMSYPSVAAKLALQQSIFRCSAAAKNADRFVYPYIYMDMTQPYMCIYLTFGFTWICDCDQNEYGFMVKDFTQAEFHSDWTATTGEVAFFFQCIVTYSWLTNKFYLIFIKN